MRRIAVIWLSAITGPEDEPAIAGVLLSKHEVAGFLVTFMD